MPGNLGSERRHFLLSALENMAIQQDRRRHHQQQSSHSIRSCTGPAGLGKFVADCVGEYNFHASTQDVTCCHIAGAGRSVLRPADDVAGCIGFRDGPGAAQGDTIQGNQVVVLYTREIECCNAIGIRRYRACGLAVFNDLEGLALHTRRAHVDPDCEVEAATLLSPRSAAHNLLQGQVAKEGVGESNLGYSSSIRSWLVLC